LHVHVAYTCHMICWNLFTSFSCSSSSKLGNCSQLWYYIGSIIITVITIAVVVDVVVVVLVIAICTFSGYGRSSYSTVMCNTVVMVMMKVNGKHQILAPPISLPPAQSTWNLIRLLTSMVWPHLTKIVKIGTVGLPRHRGEISCSMVMKNFWFLISCQALEHTVFTARQHSLLCRALY